MARSERSRDDQPRDYEEQRDYMESVLPHIGAVGGNVPLQALVTRIQRLNAYLELSAETSIASLSLSHPDYITLQVLRSGGPLTHSELAAATFARASTTTNRVDRLEARGFVRREPDPHDRRQSRVVLTAEGERTCGRAAARAERAYGALLDGFPIAQRDELTASLRRLLAFVEGKRNER